MLVLLMACAKPGAVSEAVPPSRYTGVPECDAYIDRMTACIAKMGDQRSTYERAFETTKAAWREAMVTAEGREGLAWGCKSALEAMVGVRCE